MNIPVDKIAMIYSGKNFNAMSDADLRKALSNYQYQDAWGWEGGHAKVMEKAIELIHEGKVAPCGETPPRTGYTYWEYKGKPIPHNRRKDGDELRPILKELGIEPPPERSTGHAH